MTTPTPTTVQVKIQLRRDTAATWASVNPVLLAGEAGLETDTNKIKIGNGSTAWNSLGYFPFVVNGGTVTGNLEIGTTGTLTFEGSSADNFETTLGVINPTADRTINLPNVSGTIITTGDTGTVTSTMIADGTIVDADIAANAEIAVSKLADGAARQLLQTDAAGTGVEWTSNVDIPGTLDVTGTATFDGAVTVAGDLTVNGTTTNINTQNLVVEDKNIILGDVATPTDTTADGGGITLKGATDKTINWVDSTDAWTSSERFSVPLGSAASPSLTFTGDPNTGIYSPGADQVAISTDGSGRLFVDASGNVGIGTTSPGVRFDVAGQGRFDHTAVDAILVLRSGTTVGDIGGTSGGGAFSFRSRTGIPITFNIATAEAARIDSSGRLLVGTSTARSNFNNSTVSAALQIEGTGGDSSAASLVRNSNDINPSAIRLAKSRGTANGSNTVVASGDVLGSVQFQGADGTEFVQAAIITGEVDGTPGADDMPGRLVFSTTADGASSPTERMRITSAGNVGIGTTDPVEKLEVRDGNIGLDSAGSTVGNRTTERFYKRTDNGSTNGMAAIGMNGAGTNGFLGEIKFYTGTSDVFSASLSERARIDSSGRLLVGTSTGVSAAFVSSSIQAHGFTGDGSSITLYRFTTSATAAATPRLVMARSGSDSKDFTIVANGNRLGQVNFVGADGTQFVSAASIDCEVDGTPGANDMPGRLVFSTTADGASSPTERMRITSTGAVTVGGTSTDPVGASASQVFACGPGASQGAINYYNSSNVCLKIGRGDDGALVTFFRNQPAVTQVGNISVTTTATAYNTSSDYRLKENVTAVTDGITRLQQLKPSRFNFIADPDNMVDGFLAHEVQTVVPEAISGEKDAVDADGNPVYQGIDQSKLVPLLTAALQEAVAKIESLEARLTAAGI